MRRKKLVVVAGIVAIYLLLIGGLALAAPQVIPGAAPDVTKGSRVYQGNCATCHGAQGEGRLGIPNLAGAAGHVQQLGIPPEQAGQGIIKLLREGIAGNMPAYPPSLLSDEDIGDLGAYLFTLPPTSGANLYTANCALCHGVKAEGSVGPALAGAAEKFAKLGLSKLQALRSFPDLVRKGIPGKMPHSPQLADVEVASLGDFLWDLGSWEAAFRTQHGRAPTYADRADRQWSLRFAETRGRSPNDQDWNTHDAESLNFQEVTSLDASVGVPPAGGWKWAVMRRSTGSTDVTEVNDNPNDHGNDWVFHVLRGSKDIGTPGGTVSLSVGETELLPARTLHTHRFPAQSDVLGFRVHSATARPPGEFHRGDRLFYSENALETTAGVSYKLRVRDFRLAPGQRLPGNIEAGPSFVYVVDGSLTLSGDQSSTATAGQILSLRPARTLVASNNGAAELRFVLVDLH